MNQIAHKNNKVLHEKYPPSKPCSCFTCKGFCQRPGWWTVTEAQNAIDSGFAKQMMIEISPNYNFGVLSPAFKGNECNYAFQIFSKNGCTFFNNELCQLFEAGLQPLECRFCHHERQRLGLKCHIDIENDWNSNYGKSLIVEWGNLIGFWQSQGLKLILK